MALIFLSLAWLIGIYLGMAAGAEGPQAGSWSALTWQAGGGSAAILAGVAGGAALLAHDDRQLRLTALAVAVGALGVWRGAAFLPRTDPLEAHLGSTVSLQGVVAGRPEPRGGDQTFLLQVDRLGSQDSREAAQGRVLVRTDRYREWGYGDRVVAVGRLVSVDAGSSYYAAYLDRRGVHSALQYPSLQLTARRSGTDLQWWIDALRTRWEQICFALLPEPQASLLAGILVGGRAGMPEDFQDALKLTSTSHLVAVSGFNVTVVAGVAQLATLRLLGRRRATLLALVAVWFYALLTGLPPSALRATLMATMVLSAILVGRGGDTLSFLLFSAALMVGLDPFILYDLGFQLSFLATAGLVLLEPVLRRRLQRLPVELVSPLSVTLAAQLFTLPLLVGSFHTLSLVSPLSNLLVAPILPGLMLTGGVAVGAGAISQPIGQLLAPLAWLYLTYMVEVIRWTARLPGAALATGSLEGWIIAGYYGLLLGVSLWPMAETRRAREVVGRLAGRAPRWLMVGGAAAILSLGALGASGRPDGRLHLFFLDVGQGDATLIRSRAGHWILVDGGPNPTALVDALARTQGFLDRSLEAVLLTGYDDDRLTGLLEVVRRYPVGLVMQPGSPPNRGAGRGWAERLRERGVPVVQARAGQRIPLGDDDWLEVIWATGGSDPGEEGAMVLRISSGGVRAILPGDLPRAAQSEIARRLPMGADLLLVPRHGATGALDEGFLRAVAPRAAVLSVGASNPFGHPVEGTMGMLRGVAVFRTDLNGTVEMVVDREGWEIRTER